MTNCAKFAMLIAEMFYFMVANILLFVMTAINILAKLIALFAIRFSKKRSLCIWFLIDNFHTYKFFTSFLVK